MNKIFQIGFNKCGTNSFCFLFNSVRPILRCVHWDYGRLAYTIHRNFLENKPLLTGYDDFIFFADMEGTVDGNKNSEFIYAHKEYYKLLDEQYPESKFILNTRNIHDWIRSRKAHTNRSDYEIPSYFERCKFHYKLNDQELVDRWVLDWRNHHEDVIDYFKYRPNDLLVYDINNDSIDKIKNFFPDLRFGCKEFPHSNKYKIH